MSPITVNNFDITKLDTYIQDSLSISGKALLDWVNKYKNNESDINKHFAANEIYNNYFGSTYKPNLNNYYYLINTSTNKGRLYSLQRDLVLSPKYDKTKKVVSYKDLRKLINDIFKHKRLITNSKKAIEEDIKSIRKSFDILFCRLKTLGINSIDETELVFLASSNYKKYQIFTIYKDALIDMKTIKYNLW